MQEWLRRSNDCIEQKRFEEALFASEQALLLDPENALAYDRKGFAPGELQRQTEALTAYDEALRYDPNYAFAYLTKG